MTTSIKNICHANNIYIANIYTIDIQIKYAGIGDIYIKGICARNILVRGIKPKIFTRLGEILINLRINKNNLSY